MNGRPVVSALIDLAVSVLAIALVLGSCFASTRISMDFRAIFALTCVAFFAAGIVRGAAAKSIVLQSVRLSVGGLLGIAALILNNGFHRLSISAALMVAAMGSAAAGLQARRSWRVERVRPVWIAAIWLAIAAIATTAAIPRLSTYSAFDSPGAVTEPFTLSVEGRTVSSADLRGRVVVLAFWASWCSDCYLELPHVERVYAKFRNDPRVAFYFVDTGWLNETAEKGKRALIRHQLDVPMAFDSGEAAKALKVDSLPTVLILDAKGNLHSAHYGFDASENIELGLERRLQNALDSSKSQ